MRIQQIGIALRTALERHRRYYVIRSELEGCSPRMLADLGIARDDIHDLAWKAATKKVPAAGRRAAPARSTVPQVTPRLTSRAAG